MSIYRCLGLRWKSLVKVWRVVAAFFLFLASVSYGQSQSCVKSFQLAVPEYVDGKLQNDEKAIQARMFAELLSFQNMVQELRMLTGEDDLFPGTKISDRNSSFNRDKVRKYIGEKLVKLGYQSEDESFERQYGGWVVNVIGKTQGTEFSDEVIEIVTHYDTAGWNVPGADDNGTGVVLALELARLFKIHKPKRSIRFVFTDLEESGSHGADHHVENLKKRSEQLIGAYIIDMIGYYPKGKAPKFVIEVGNDEHIESTDGLTRNRMLANQFIYQYARFQDRRIQLIIKQKDSKPTTGDHDSYWSKGFPALFVAAPYEFGLTNPHNHSSSDTVGTMNLDYFEAVSRVTTEAIAYAAGMDVVPTTSPERVAIYSELVKLQDEEVLPSDNYLEKEAPTVRKTYEYKPLPEKQAAASSQKEFGISDFKGLTAVIIGPTYSLSIENDSGIVREMIRRGEMATAEIAKLKLKGSILLESKKDDLKANVKPHKGLVSLLSAIQKASTSLAATDGIREILRETTRPIKAFYASGTLVVFSPCDELEVHKFSAADSYPIARYLLEHRINIIVSSVSLGTLIKREQAEWTGDEDTGPEIEFDE